MNIFGQPLCSGVWLGCGLLALIGRAGLLIAQTPLDEESPWPRVRSTNGHTVTLHLPQVETWTSNSFTARAAVEVKPAGAKKELLGVIWIAAHGRVDHSSRMVMLDRMEITKARFPETPGPRDSRSSRVTPRRAARPSPGRYARAQRRSPCDSRTPALVHAGLSLAGCHRQHHAWRSR